ncbi:hypothetical protein [Algoriphagus sp.]|uniref:hypothetical protein n=1 Tax=Algoriphagus sp. TaxID=1872435 RepID=UPI00391D425B
MIPGKTWKKVIFSIAVIFTVGNYCFAQKEGLFDSEEILEITLKGDVRALFANTKGEAEYFGFTLGYSDNYRNPNSIPLRVKTRGHFRREMNICDYPPLLLNFAKENVANTIFSSQDKVKLVMPCRGEKYVMREYLTYKIYNQLTPNSFKVRLVRLTVLNETDSGKSYEPFLGFLIEEEEQMAQRVKMASLDKDLVKPESVVKDDFLRMAVFQYLIGNTDWSVQYRQNIKLISSSEGTDLIAVPYDFDHAGIVRAPYAKPAPELKLATITDRRYRGYCIDDMRIFEKTFEEFKAKKEAIYALYSESELLDDKYIKSTIKFLDGFYTTLSNPKRAKFDFQYPCLADGTGNVVIKGLK